MKTMTAGTWLAIATAVFLARRAEAKEVADHAAAESGDSAADIARKLNNPVSSLISVPLQNNFDFGGGPRDEGFQYRLNVQPVIPFSLGDSWNLITRTIVAFITQEKRTGIDSSETGLGDTTLSLFLSPKKPGPGGLMWGVGPEFYFPTATDDVLGAEKWGVGPTVLGLFQKHGWTYGILANHVWSVAGEESRQDISSTFVQPFLSYQTKTHTTFGTNMESTYDWENEQWTVPLNLFVSQLVKMGKLPVSLQLGGRYYAVKPSGGPDWGLRFTMTFAFPK
jgi:hypothetical protein